MNDWYGSVEPKIKEMLVDTQKKLLDECKRLYESGAVDTGSYDTDYVLPKILLTVALENVTEEYKPKMQIVQEDLENLRHF